MEVARPSPRRGTSKNSRRRAEMVDTDGLWCCIVRRPVTVVREDVRNVSEKEFVLRSKELEALIKNKGSPFKLRLSPGRVSPISDNAIVPVRVSNGSSKTLTPPSPPAEGKTKASPTLLEMMALEQETSRQQSVVLSLPRPPSVQEKVDAILLLKSPGNQFNDPVTGDVKLTLTGKDGFNVSISVHRHVLTSQSRFFAAKFSDWWSKQHRSPLNAVEISDCEDVDVYLQTIRLMYCRDLRRSLLKENVSRVLGILKVSAAILFEAGVVACLEYLEAMPWPEDEEDKITALVSQLQLDNMAAMEVLKRLSIIEAVESETIITRLLQSVIEGTEEKARREMKGLVLKMLRENTISLTDSCKSCFYRACDSCIESLLHLFKRVISEDMKNAGTLAAQISRQADNLNWVVDILIERQISEEFVKIWACQKELSDLYTQVPSVYRYDVSRVTARICVAIGRGQVLVPQEVRFSLLQTWFQSLVDDFGWLQRCSKGLDKKAVEDGVSQTILTLPLKQQQGILLSWFDCFSRSSGDCPNLNRAFEVWWRRTFVRPLLETSLPQLTN